MGAFGAVLFKVEDKPNSPALGLLLLRLFLAH